MLKLIKGFWRIQLTKTFINQETKNYHLFLLVPESAAHESSDV